MTIQDILTGLGLAEQIIGAIGDLIDISEEVTPEQMADIRQAMDDAEAAWGDA